MKAKERKTKLITFFTCFLLLIALLVPVHFSMADDHGKKVKHGDNHEGESGEGMLGGFRGLGHDDGNETTGQMVAWSLAAANLTVALSILIRGLKDFVPLAPETKNTLTKFNNTQKKYLMKFHYLLNPVILLVAIVHWTLSRCKSTAMPEWGLLIMGTIVTLGIILKFKLCPRDLLRKVYKVHTQPMIFILMMTMLLIGHLSMD